MVLEISEEKSATGELTPARRVILVPGSGRSGTSTVVGILKLLGVRVPGPEVPADATNPRGFGESTWVVRLHDELLRRSFVEVSDARPDAWLAAGKLCVVEDERARVTAWLANQLEKNPEVVIKDPRLAWFLGLWEVAALRCSASTVSLTMVRPPQEVVSSKKASYASDISDSSRTAAWLNMMLYTERATRDSSRLLLRYHDLLTDWVEVLGRVGEVLGVDAVRTANTGRILRVHDFVDPDLYRMRSDWSYLDVPAALRGVAERTWSVLNDMCDPEGDTNHRRSELDEIRREYTRFYSEAAEMTSSTVRAARREGRAMERGELTTEPAQSKRDVLERVPHRVRAMVPEGGSAARPEGARDVEGGQVTKNRSAPAVMDNIEGEDAYRITWPWAGGGAPAHGLTAVLRVKNEARCLGWVLPPLFRCMRYVVLVDNDSEDDTIGVARRLAAEHDFRGLVVRTYPFRISRCGAEHRNTPERSVHSLVYFYNWAFSHVTTTYSLKWDGDMVLTTEGERTLLDLQWRLEGADAVVAMPRHPLYVESDRVAYIDLGLRNVEPWLQRTGPEYRFVKAFEWELQHVPPRIPVIQLPEGLCAELKWLDADEFAHWTSADDFVAPGRTIRKRREWEVMQLLLRGELPDPACRRIVSPAGTHVVDYVKDEWMRRSERPLVALPPGQKV